MVEDRGEEKRDGNQQPVGDARPMRVGNGDVFPRSQLSHQSCRYDHQ